MSASKRAWHDIDVLRARVPGLDHGIRAYRQYSAQEGSTLAAAVTYFAFLSLFPLLALAFASVGFVAKFVPDAQQALDATLQNVFPGMVGDGADQISLTSIQHAAGTVAGIGILTVTYSGLSWISEMRDALAAMFEVDSSRAPALKRGQIAAFFSAQFRDIVALTVVGLALVFSVMVSGGLLAFVDQIRRRLGVDADLDLLMAVLLVGVGTFAGAVLFFAMFKLLAEPEVPNRALWSGALLGALGFEVLKQASKWLLASTANQPAFQSFGIALILLVWIYYFSRVVMFAAAWAKTATEPRQS